MSGWSVFRRDAHRQGRASSQEQLSSCCCGNPREDSRPRQEQEAPTEESETFRSGRVRQDAGAAGHEEGRPGDLQGHSPREAGDDVLRHPQQGHQAGLQEGKSTFSTVAL